MTRFGFVLSAFGAVSCAAPMVSTNAYLAAQPELSAEDKAAWDSLSVGKRVVFQPGHPSCGVTRASSLEDLRKGQMLVPAHPANAKPELLTIQDARVQSGHAGYVALQVRAASGTMTWLRVSSESPMTCLMPATPELQNAVAMRGTVLRFTPWKTSCRQVHASGTAPSAMLIENAGVPLEAEDFEVGSASALEANKGRAIWIRFNNQSLKVRADTVRDCFEAAGAGAADATHATALLHLDRMRCATSPDEGREHVECRSSVGLWEGVVRSDAIALQLVHRTLGPIHFLNNRPVAGSRYAKAVVAVTKGQAQDGRAQALYQTLDRAVSEAVAREGQGSVRIAPAGAGDVTYRVHVDVSSIQIGDLAISEVTETTKYKVRDDVRPNPAKPKAKERVERARIGVTQAEAAYDRDVKIFDELKEAAKKKCDEAADKVSGPFGALAGAACDVGAGIIQPSRSGVETAQTELTESETALAGTPDTITVPIMADWSYQRKNYSRSTSANLTIAMQSATAAQGTTVSVPLGVSWSDYEVQADPAHNVQGHAPEQGPLRDSEALIPLIAQKASAELAVRLKAAISNAAIEQAVRAFVAAGNQPPKPGFEAVDALAFEAASGRLGQVVLQGTADLVGGKPFVLPSRVAKLGENECLLAIAAGAGDAAMDLSLKNLDASHADLRGNSIAVVELCRSELRGKDSIDALELASKIGGSARWGLYRTRNLPAVAPPEPAAPTRTVLAPSSSSPAPGQPSVQPPPALQPEPVLQPQPAEAPAPAPALLPQGSLK